MALRCRERAPSTTSISHRVRPLAGPTINSAHCAVPVRQAGDVSTAATSASVFELERRNALRLLRSTALRLERRDLGQVGDRRNAAGRHHAGNVGIVDKGGADVDLAVRRLIASCCYSLPSIECKGVAGFERQRTRKSAQCLVEFAGKDQSPAAI